MSKILVTGADGQLGREIKKLRNTVEDIYEFTDIDQLDLTDREGLLTHLRRNPVDFIVNCAAYTLVDKAEDEPDRAMLLNRDIPANLRACLDEFPGLRVVHISTDYVFKGDLARPLNEEDTPNPQSVYGKSKWEGEKILRDHSRVLLIRTSWLYSMFGRNFVKTMINKMDQHDELRVVYDQVGTPTYAEDLARAIMTILRDVDRNVAVFVPGIFHYSNEGVCSWYDLAVEICRHSGCKRKSQIVPVLTREFSLPAPRPAYSVLDKTRIKEVYGVEVPHWRESLEKCIKNLL
ncbi:MAG: dTDP-4-dehydrorhamnose reductase [Bacteroidales bacterium]